MPEAWFDEYGYTEDEYFVSGDATAYSAKGTLSTDGKWDVAATDETAPYTTRVVVRRPKDAADFNGTLVVEWLNVSAGRDSDPDFGFLAQELGREVNTMGSKANDAEITHEVVAMKGELEKFREQLENLE